MAQTFAPLQHPTHGTAVVRTVSAPVDRELRGQTAGTSGHPRHSTAPVPGPFRTHAPAAASAYTSRADWAKAVLAELNAERAGNYLKPLTVDARLTTAAHNHALAMAKANQLSHQLPGEASLGTRITAAGYTPWSNLGENIGVSSAQTQDAAVGLEKLMYGETPPNDGHRRNILSANYVNVGIDVIVDATHHQLWLVTDFGKTM